MLMAEANDAEMQLLQPQVARIQAESLSLAEAGLLHVA